MFFKYIFVMKIIIMNNNLGFSFFNSDYLKGYLYNFGIILLKLKYIIVFWFFLWEKLCILEIEFGKSIMFSGKWKVLEGVVFFFL